MEFELEPRCNQVEARSRSLQMNLMSFRMPRGRLLGHPNSIELRTVFLFEKALRFWLLKFGTHEKFQKKRFSRV
jgi:hypothetical protein